MLLAQQGKVGEALGRFETVLRLRPDAQAHYNLALACAVQGRLKEAAAHYEQAIQLRADWALALNDLAWILATAPLDSLRNGTRAVQLAQRACELEGEKEPRFWGTLDAAYAEAGRFAEAIATAEKTRQLALAGGQQDLAGHAETRLALYRKGQPFRQ